MTEQNKDLSNKTALDWAREHGHTEIVKILESHPSFNNIPTDSPNYNKTALDVAREIGHTEIAKYLESVQASQIQPDTVSSSKTALDVARELGHKGIADMLNNLRNSDAPNPTKPKNSQ